MLNYLTFDASVPKSGTAVGQMFAPRPIECRLKNNNEMKIFPILRLNKDARFNGNIPATNKTKVNKKCTLKEFRN